MLTELLDMDATPAIVAMSAALPEVLFAIETEIPLIV